MTILCIETSTSVCSVAICKGGVPLKQCINYEGSNHARLLPLYIEELLSFAREQHLSIDAVALSEGPGSYTGLRIGASTAKGLCYGLNVPLIPVPTLEVLCQAAKEKIDTAHTYTLIPMIDARRMEVYTCINGETKAVVVENEESLLSLSTEDCLWPSESSKVSPLSAKRSIYYFGDGAAKCEKVFTQPEWHLVPDIVPEAQYVGVLAEQITNRKSQIANAKSTDLAYYEPFYLKEFVAAPSHVKGLS